MGIPSLHGTLLSVLSFVTIVLPANAADAAAAASGAPSPGSSILFNPLDLDATALKSFEAFLILVVVIFVINFAVGVRRNINFAKHLADTLDSALAFQFASLGVAGGSGKRLIRDGATKFWYYATGRLRTTGFVAALHLRPRQDLFALTGTLFGGTEPESIVIIAPIDSNNMDPVSVLLMQRRQLARWREMRDGEALKNAQKLAGEVTDYTGIDGDFVVMAEHKDSISAVLTGRVKEMLADVEDNLRSVHVTDFATHCATWEAQCGMARKIVRVEAALPDAQADRERVVKTLSEVVCALVDVAASVKISPAAKKKAIELRRGIVADEDKIKQKKRKEEIAAEKEAKKKEKEAAVAKMSREKQAKHDEKMRKKAFKDRLKKVSVK